MTTAEHGANTRRLLPHHLEQLHKSGINDPVIAERGYWSATRPGELRALGYSDAQAALVPALVIPMQNGSGQELTQIKPNHPRPDRDKPGKFIKYETPAGHAMILDIPARTRSVLRDPSVTLVITEGAKKVDSAASAGMYPIGVVGVWGWKRDKKPLPDWDAIALAGRHVTIAYDSDVVRKHEVRDALLGLTVFLQEAGTIVRIVLLPDNPDGSKNGLDDILAAGRTGELPEWTFPATQALMLLAQREAYLNRVVGEDEEAKRIIENQRETIATLQKENDQLHKLLSHESKLHRNQRLRPAERLVLEAATLCAAQASRNTPETLVRIPLARVAEQAGVSESTVGRVIAKAASDKWGNLLRKDIGEGEGPAYPFHNRLTGRTETRYADVTYIGLTQPLIETLEAAAELDPAELDPDRKPHGGPRKRYICRDHPDADVACVWQAVCTECGTVLDEGKRLYPNPSSGEQDAPSWDEGSKSPSSEQDATLSTNGRVPSYPCPSKKHLAPSWENGSGSEEAWQAPVSLFGLPPGYQDTVRHRQGQGGCSCGGLLVLLGEHGRSVLRCCRCGKERAPDGGDPEPPDDDWMVF